MTTTRQHGFTLIELVLVIVILGILAAVAVPRFIDLSEQAESASISAQASALTSASAINFAGYKAGLGTGGGSGEAVEVSAANVCTNAVANSLLTDGPFGVSGQSAFTITGTGDCAPATANETVTCTISRAGADAESTATLFCTN